jgi:hypothetical protein
MSTKKTTRPILKVDANNFDIQSSSNDMTMRGEESGGNLIYIGFARPGSAEGDDEWQLRKLTYGAGGNVIKIEWPENTLGVASSEYVFNWTGRAGYTYV